MRFHEVANIFPLMQGEDFEPKKVTGIGEKDILFVQQSYDHDYFFVWNVDNGTISGFDRPIRKDCLPEAIGFLAGGKYYQWYKSVCQPISRVPYFAGNIMADDNNPLVYFIKGGNLVKIGVAINPSERLKQIQSMSPISVELLGIARGGFELETFLHRRFASLRRHGEWFEMNNHLAEYIRGVIDDAN